MLTKRSVCPLAATNMPERKKEQCYKRHSNDIFKKPVKVEVGSVLKLSLRNTSERLKFGALNIRNKQLQSVSIAHIRRNAIQSVLRKPRCEKFFECLVRGKIFINEYNLNLHLDNRKQTCKICGRKFCTFRLARKHFQMHREKKSECKVCGKILIDDYNLNLHLDNRKQTCKICGEKFCTLKLAQKHIQMHREKKSYSCNECGKEVCSKLALEDHLKTHEVEKAGTCNICDDLVHTKAMSEENMEETNEAKTITVDTNLTLKGYFETRGCIEKYEFGQEGGVHIETGAGEKAYENDIFDRGLPEIGVLSDHIPKHMKKKSDKCKMCGKGFCVAASLRVHLRTHIGERSHLCDVCGKTFDKPYCFHIHRRKHTGVLAYSCEICGREYEDKNIRRRKLRYFCDFCGKWFKYKMSFKSHVQKHTGEEPYLCDLCGERFRLCECETRETLVQRLLSKKKYTKEIVQTGASMSDKKLSDAQLNTYTGGKRHVCTYCDKVFRKRFDFAQHLRTHTGEKPFICYFCGKSFTRSLTKRIHMKRHFPDKEI